MTTNTSSTSAVKLGDLNDFISPSQACVKPVNIPKDSKSAKVTIEADGTYAQLLEDGTKQTLEKATITLNDCLACSGCVTSAETVLIEMQNHKELESILSKRKEDPAQVVCACVSQQSLASIAARYALPIQEAAEHLTGFLKSIGLDFVFDISAARSLSLQESAQEFSAALASKLPATRDSDGSHADSSSAVVPTLPIIASSCPGWICYAEKTEPALIPHISRIKSPQQISGSLMKGLCAHARSVQAKDVYVVTIMPCFDKKLEASREDFFMTTEETKEVDCVIVSSEVEAMLNERNMSLADAPKFPLDSLLTLEPEQRPIQRHVGTSSGGYLHHVTAHAARQLFEAPLGEADIVLKTGRRGSDFQEYAVEIGGTIAFQVAKVYGFRGVRNIAKRIKKGKCAYDYIEIMACPQGCTNGGGQIRRAEESPYASDKLLLETVEQTYQSLPGMVAFEDERVAVLQEKAFGELGLSRAEVLTTQYHPVEQTVLPQFEQW